MTTDKTLKAIRPSEASRSQAMALAKSRSWSKLNEPQRKTRLLPVFLQRP